MTTLRNVTDHEPAPSRWATLRAGLRDRRDARAAHAFLQRELAEVRTPSAVYDLLAAVDRQEPAGAEQIRGILSDNLTDYHRARRLTGDRA